MSSPDIEAEVGVAHYGWMIVKVLTHCHSSDTTCYDFVKLTFVKWSTGFRTPNSARDCERNGNREVHYSQVLEEIPGTPPGAAWGGQGVLADRAARPGVHAFIRVCGCSALGFSG